MCAFGPLNFAHPSNRNTAFEEHDFNANEEVSCLFCPKEFVVPKDLPLFTSHLFSCHQFIISEIQNIASLKMYVEYWKARFLSDPPDAVCTNTLSDAKIDGTKIYCLLLGDYLPEDRRLREELKNKRLVWALEQQAREREDTNFARGCLLCRLDFHGSRSDYLEHLSLMHNMHLGKPENLVFIDQLISAIEDKLNSLKCLYCSRTFKNRPILKEHMRKKQHKKINPEHTEFDRFFIINYTEVGKNWQDLQSEMDDDSPSVKTPDGSKTPEAMSDGEWSDWEEDEEPVVCLFCSTSSNYDMILRHMKDVHYFDFTLLSIQNNLNFYHQVKLVNYIRKQIHSGNCPFCLEKHLDLLSHMTSAGHFSLPHRVLWDQPEYYFPTYENDSFLCNLDDRQDDMSELQLSMRMEEACQMNGN